MSSTRPNRLLLASIHDVSPRFEGEVDRLIDLLAPHVGTKMAMLVVPNHWGDAPIVPGSADRKSTRLNSSHLGISYAVFCLKKKITMKYALLAECLDKARTQHLGRNRT